MLQRSRAPRPTRKLVIWPMSTAFPWLNNIVYLGLGQQRTNTQANTCRLSVRIVKASMNSSSLAVYCHSASGLRSSLFLPSSSTSEYVGSGGRNANLAAILDGQGGQQNIPHSFLNAGHVRPVMAVVFNLSTKSKTHFHLTNFHRGWIQFRPCLQYSEVLQVSILRSG